MLAFLRRPRTQRLREYERQLAVQVTVFAIAPISEAERHDLDRGRPREPIDRPSPRNLGFCLLVSQQTLALYFFFAFALLFCCCWRGGAARLTRTRLGCHLGPSAPVVYLLHARGEAQHRQTEASTGRRRGLLFFGTAPG